MSEEFSQTKKAKAARQWRAKNTQKKRFDSPLKEFIKVKHSGIYKEYSEMYAILDKKYPHIRDLSKTPMFRKWVNIVQSSESESENEDRPTISSGLAMSVEVQPEVESTQQAEPDILSRTVQEYIENEALDLSKATLDIDEIVSELEQDPMIRGILDPLVDDMLNQQNLLDPVFGNNEQNINQDDDEGIELNVLDEIDIEPFDFNTEVGDYDF